MTSSADRSPSAPSNVASERMHFQTIATGLGFVEGPVIAGRDVFVVSLDLGHVYEVSTDGSRLLAATGGAPNGAALDRDGTVFVAQNGGHSPGQVRRSQPGGLQAIDPEGRVRWLSLDPIFPTDLCLGPDGWIYLTDSTRNNRYDDGRLWRCDPATGSTELLYSVPWFPNGIAFGPDNRLYVASTGDRTVYVCPWDEGRVGDPEVYCQLARGRPDGLAFDVEGTLLVAAVGSDGDPGMIAVIDPAGAMVDTIVIGTSTHYTNIALATDHPRLVVTDSTAGTLLETRDYPHLGLQLYPFRNSG